MGGPISESSPSNFGPESEQVLRVVAWQVWHQDAPWIVASCLIMISLSPPPVPVPATSECLHNFKHCSHYHNPGALQWCCFLYLLLQGWFLDHCILASLVNVHLRPSAPCGAQTVPAMPFTSRWTWSPQTRSGYMQLWTCHPKRWIFQPFCMLHVRIDRLSVVHIHIPDAVTSAMFGWSMVVKNIVWCTTKKLGWGWPDDPTWSPGGDQDGFPWGQLEIGENLMLSEAGCHQPCGAPWAWHIHDIKMMNV